MDPLTISAIIAALGGVGSAFLGNKSGKTKERKAERFTDEQQALLKQILSGTQRGLPSAFENIQGLLSNDPAAFAKFEQPYKTQFAQETVPMLAERFTGTGAGSQSSSAFQQALGQAGAGLSEKLAALRGNLQQNAMSQLFGLAGTGLTPSFESVLSQGDQGFGSSIAPFLGQLGGVGLSGGMQELLGRGDFDRKRKLLESAGRGGFSNTQGGPVAQGGYGFFRPFGG